MSVTRALYIDGEWVETDDSIENINPSDTTESVGRYAQATPELADHAIASANRAAKEWGQSPMETRYQMLMAIGDEMIARCDELGEVLSREEGKPRAEGRGEVYRAGQFFQYYAAEVLRQMGDTADSVRPGVEIEVRREPMGVVTVISPWNFPTATASWKIAPALAFGNAVIWKPANLTPASAVLLTEIIAKQDIPAGLFNLVMGAGGGTVGNHIINSDQIHAVTFTGSLPVGRQVATAIDNMARVQLEMGSKNALVVLDDADIDVAVNCALAGGYFGTGQKCTASSRIIVESGIHDEFVAKMTEAMSKLGGRHGPRRL